MTQEQRDKIIDKILETYESEELFNKLSLDFEEIFINALKTKSDDELLEFIL